MKKFLLVALLFVPGAFSTGKYRCVCNDETAVMPECGICGTELGTMELTLMGVACMCDNNLKLKEISCADVCKARGGWSGDVK